MQDTNTVAFAPQTTQQVRALVKYITEETRPIINTRRASEEYRTAVTEIRDIMQAHFAQYPSGRVVRKCPWTLLGTKDKCATIATRYNVPYWDVVVDANPSMPF